MDKETKSIAASLAAVQAELRVPKGQRNTFGGYNYRSAEDILEAAKPLLVKHGLVLTLSDSIQEVGGRIYVKAEAVVETIDAENERQSVQVSAYAREAEAKKGMDESQITGMASSYARKYALNGLFCIDDNKDADNMEAAREQALMRLAAAATRAEFNALQKEFLALIKADAATKQAFAAASARFPKTASETTQETEQQNRTTAADKTKAALQKQNKK